MPVYKDKSRGTWYVVTRYKDWTGKLRTTTKRGFKSKVEAKRYEVEFSEKKDNRPNDESRYYNSIIYLQQAIPLNFLRE